MGIGSAPHRLDPYGFLTNLAEPATGPTPSTSGGILNDENGLPGSSRLTPQGSSRLAVDTVRAVTPTAPHDVRAEPSNLTGYGPRS